jgi:hypothetical protein
LHVQVADGSELLELPASLLELQLTLAPEYASDNELRLGHLTGEHQHNILPAQHQCEALVGCAQSKCYVAKIMVAHAGWHGKRCGQVIISTGQSGKGFKTG